MYFSLPIQVFGNYRIGVILNMEQKVFDLSTDLEHLVTVVNCIVPPRGHDSMRWIADPTGKAWVTEQFLRFYGFANTFHDFKDAVTFDIDQVQEALNLNEAFFEQDAMDVVNAKYYFARQKYSCVDELVELVMRASEIVKNFDMREYFPSFVPGSLRLQLEEDNYSLGHVPKVFLYAERLALFIQKFRTGMNLNEIDALEPWIETTRRHLIAERAQRAILEDKKISERFPICELDPIRKKVKNRLTVSDINDAKKFAEEILKYSAEEKRSLANWEKNGFTQRIEGFRYFRAKAFAEVFREKFFFNSDATDALDMVDVLYPKGSVNYMSVDDQRSLVRRFEAQLHDDDLEPEVQELIKLKRRSTLGKQLYFIRSP
jgi:hypothetical protein